MPFELDSHPGPLPTSDSELDDLLDDLQGNILNGHGRDHAVHLFLRFNHAKIAELRRIISGLTPEYVTSAKAQLEASLAYKTSGVDAGLFVHVAFSAHAYEAFGLEAPHGANLRGRNASDGYVDAFSEGMKRRQKALQDPAWSTWEDEYQGTFDALILLAADQRDLLGDTVKAIRALLEVDRDVPLAFIECEEAGMMQRRRFPGSTSQHGEPVEHFGFADGISQPVLLASQVESSSSAAWDPVAPPKLVLVRDPHGAGSSSFGSFLVFRKLEQNVRAFRRALEVLGAELGSSPELLGAMAVGRFENGTPVVAHREPLPAPTLTTAFDFAGDPDGHRCPFQAHIRKTNPRLEASALGALSQTPEEERGHRIARRAIPYPAVEREDFDAPAAELPESGWGLLFMCYQSDIWEQFEFQQRAWANNSRFLHPRPYSGTVRAPAYASGTGIDPIIGQELPERADPNAGPADPRNWPLRWNVRPKRTVHSVAHCVKLLGGEYFFSPSRSGLRNLDPSAPVIPRPT